MNEGDPVLSPTRGVCNKPYNATVFSNNLSVVSIGRYATRCQKSIKTTCVSLGRVKYTLKMCKGQVWVNYKHSTWPNHSKSPRQNSSRSKDLTNGQNGFADLKGSSFQLRYTKMRESHASNCIDLCNGRRGRWYKDRLRIETKRKRDYDVVKTKFDGHFVVRCNAIFERSKFSRRSQEEGESGDSFIISLYCLAEHCKYEHLQNMCISQ